MHNPEGRNRDARYRVIDTCNLNEAYKFACMTFARSQGSSQTQSFILRAVHDVANMHLFNSFKKTDYIQKGPYQLLS